MNMAEKILVPIDGSEQANRALEYAVKIAKGINAEIVLLNVQYSYNTPYVKRFIKQSEVEDYQRQLADEAFEAATAIDTSGAVLHAERRIGEPASEICKAAEEQEVTSIIMGSRGLGAVKRGMLGSVSYRVLHEASCPVTVVN